ncbi:hypothetical protein Mal15_42120 [Stieleria maiorica]|uniref:Uncharacterized protein n=1 Tax=Stieleria maiorica TaxID=2795974 RepID=A0A5B9MFV3_9BACT|nr:hypothetical protein Mal15_42120 [Stieleria maiorica]
MIRASDPGHATNPRRPACRRDRRLDRKQARKRYQIAQKVLAAVCNTSPRRRLTPISTDSLQRLLRLQRLEPVAVSRGWLLAANRLHREFAVTLKSLRESIDQSLVSMAEIVEPGVRCELPELIGDLAALEADFESVELNVKNGTVGVITEPIELEGVLLGPFKIEFEIRYLGQSTPYRVIATDPQPAVSCDSTTHPHVQSEALCEGDGQQPIKHALADGRLYDFFLIVRQILQTYNPDSAYISLGDWFGVECGDCGANVDEDDTCRCDRCGRRTCSDCSCGCEACDESFCHDCTSICEGCRSYYCNGCMESCDRCGESFCKHCLTENQCDDCLDQETNEERSQEPTETPAEAEQESNPEVQPLRLGETEVPT